MRHSKHTHTCLTHTRLLSTHMHNAQGAKSHEHTGMRAEFTSREWFECARGKNNRRLYSWYGYHGGEHVLAPTFDTHSQGTRIFVFFYFATYTHTHNHTHTQTWRGGTVARWCGGEVVRWRGGHIQTPIHTLTDPVTTTITITCMFPLLLGAFC